MATALSTLMALPAVALVTHASPVSRLARFEQAMGPGSPRIFIKRDDLLEFGLGGNKVRKLQTIAGDISRVAADTVITCGALQSNHARVTAAAGAALGWRVVLVLSGTPPELPTGNLRHDYLFGAEVRLVATRDEREAAMQAAAAEETRDGRRPYVIPVGASTPLGAMGMARGVTELSAARFRPDLIVHASSSAGTQAGLTAGCSLVGLPARIVGVSADQTAAALAREVGQLLDQMAGLLGCRPDTLRGSWPVNVDDSQVGGGYGVSTEASREARTLLACTEGIVLDTVYTAKALAGLIAMIRAGQVPHDATVLFWHTGGLCE